MLFDTFSLCISGCLKHERICLICPDDCVFSFAEIFIYSCLKSEMCRHDRTHVLEDVNISPFHVSFCAVKILPVWGPMNSFTRHLNQFMRDIQPSHNANAIQRKLSIENPFQLNSNFDWCSDGFVLMRWDSLR